MNSNTTLAYATTAILGGSSGWAVSAIWSSRRTDRTIGSEDWRLNSHSYSETGFVENFFQPGYTTYDASMGVAKDAWTVQIYGQNITDANYVTFIDADQFIKEDFVGRPRTIGVKFGYKF